MTWPRWWLGCNPGTGNSGQCQVLPAAAPQPSTRQASPTLSWGSNAQVQAWPIHIGSPSQLGWGANARRHQPGLIGLTSPVSGWCWAGEDWTGQEKNNPGLCPVLPSSCMAQAEGIMATLHEWNFPEGFFTSFTREERKWVDQQKAF